MNPEDEVTIKVALAELTAEVKHMSDDIQELRKCVFPARGESNADSNLSEFVKSRFGKTVILFAVVLMVLGLMNVLGQDANAITEERITSLMKSEVRALVKEELTASQDTDTTGGY